MNICPCCNGSGEVELPDSPLAPYIAEAATAYGVPPGEITKRRLERASRAVALARRMVIRMARELTDWTQREIADALGVDHTAVTHHCTTKISASEEARINIAIIRLTQFTPH